MNPTSTPTVTTTATQTSSEHLLPYMDMGTGFIIGLSVGYVLKKSFKLLLLILGIGMIGIFVLENKGLMSINEANVENTVSHFAGMFQDFTVFLKNRLSTFQVSKGLSAVAGFFVGLKMG